MKVLNIKIINQKLQWENAFPIVAGSQEYLYCKFIYPKDWETLKKEIRFYNSFDKKYYNIDNSQGLIPIPYEVLKGNNFFIAVGGYKDSIFVPTSALEIPLLNNDFGEPDETIEEGSPAYDTVTALLLNLATKAPYIGENNNWFIWNNELNQYEDSGQASQGKSAYQIALDNGFEGTEQEWLESLKGEKGEQGLQGERGEQGIQGIQGLKGDRGEDGYTPKKGVDYFDGKDGRDGQNGKDGISVTHEWNDTRLKITSASGTSSADLKGQQGEQGPQGEKGDVGPKGDKGDTGEQGIQGPTGPQGKSAYEIAVDNGFEGTEEEWLESLKGEKGDAGISITVDDAISDTSENPVQNKVIKAYVDSEVSVVKSFAISAAQRATEAKAQGEKAESIAKGRATGYAFDTEEDMLTWLGEETNKASLVLGDNFYIRAIDVPDYWWDGTNPQPLETQKVDLSEYATKAEVFKVAIDVDLAKANAQQALDKIGDIDEALDEIIAIQEALIGGDTI